MADYCLGDTCSCKSLVSYLPDTARLEELERRVDGLERMLNAALRSQPQGKHSKKSA